jgi:two-component system response regulator DesR
VSTQTLTDVVSQLMQPTGHAIEDALPTVLASTGAARVSLAVFSDTGFEMVAFAGRSLLASGVQMPCDASSLLATARRGEVFIDRDFQSSLMFDRPVDRLMLASGFRSAYAIPLSLGSETIAALSLSSTRTDGLSNQPVLDLQSLGAVFCMALKSRDLWRPARILICHDDTLVAGGVARLLESSIQAEVTFASDAVEASITEGSFDIVISDVMVFGRPLDVLRDLCPAARSAPLIALASYDTPEHEQMAFDAGARAYLVKEDAHRLPAILSAVRDGTLPMPTRPAGLRTRSLLPRLTRRESDVLLRLDQGLTVRQISRDLDVSEATAKGYMRGLFIKFGAHSRAQAVQLARRQGILQGLLTTRSAALAEADGRSLSEDSMDIR